jgi:hypothetical protein
MTIVNQRSSVLVSVVRNSSLIVGLFFRAQLFEPKEQATGPYRQGVSYCPTLGAHLRLEMEEYGEDPTLVGHILVAGYRVPASANGRISPLVHYTTPWHVGRTGTQRLCEIIAGLFSRAQIFEPKEQATGPYRQGVGYCPTLGAHLRLEMEEYGEDPTLIGHILVASYQGSASANGRISPLVRYTTPWHVGRTGTQRLPEIKDLTFGARGEDPA